MYIIIFTHHCLPASLVPSLLMLFNRFASFDIIFTILYNFYLKKKIIFNTQFFVFNSNISINATNKISLENIY